MKVFFYSDEYGTLVKGWQIGLKTCGVETHHVFKSLIKQTSNDFIPDLRVIDEPSEFELDVLSENKNIPTACVIYEYKDYYKKYDFVKLWIAPCFYDKHTEQSMKGLPFYYCPLASQDCFAPFYTELNKQYDLSTDDPLKEKWETITIPKGTPHPEVIYANCKVNLNYIIPKPDFVYLNQKAFDICFTGNFQLCTIPEVEQIFEGKVGYTSETEMKDKIDYYINHEEERTRMAIKAYEVCIAKHTYTYRMRDLLKKLQLL